MADISNIRTDITPDQVTIDNIDEWNSYSENAINKISNQISDNNILINDLIGIFMQEIETHHFIGTKSQMDQMSMSNVKSGSVFFIQKEEL